MSYENASHPQPNVRINPKTAKTQHFPGADRLTHFALPFPLAETAESLTQCHGHPHQQAQPWHEIRFVAESSNRPAPAGVVV